MNSHVDSARLYNYGSPIKDGRSKTMLYEGIEIRISGSETVSFEFEDKRYSAGSYHEAQDKIDELITPETKFVNTVEGDTLKPDTDNVNPNMPTHIWEQTGCTLERAREQVSYWQGLNAPERDGYKAKVQMEYSNEPEITQQMLAITTAWIQSPIAKAEREQKEREYREGLVTCFRTKNVVKREDCITYCGRSYSLDSLMPEELTFFGF